MTFQSVQRDLFVCPYVKAWFNGRGGWRTLRQLCSCCIYITQKGIQEGLWRNSLPLTGSSLERQGVLDSRQLQPISLCWDVVLKDQIKRLLRIPSSSHFHNEQMDVWPFNLAIIASHFYWWFWQPRTFATIDLNTFELDRGGFMTIKRTLLSEDCTPCWWAFSSCIFVSFELIKRICLKAADDWQYNIMLLPLLMLDSSSGTVFCNKIYHGVLDDPI